MSDRLVLQLLFEARIPVRSRRGVCQKHYDVCNETHSVANGTHSVANETRSFTNENCDFKNRYGNENKLISGNYELYAALY
jgi:hypothetical protein